MTTYKCNKCGYIFESGEYDIGTECPKCNNLRNDPYFDSKNNLLNNKIYNKVNYNYDLKQLTKEILISISQNTNLCFNNDTNKHDYNGLVEHSSKIAEAYLKWSEKQ